MQDLRKVLIQMEAQVFHVKTYIQPGLHLMEERYEPSMTS